jgi:DivIVA domain-containing protein
MLETTLGVLLVAAIVFAIVVAVTGKADLYTEVPPDGRPQSAPVDRPVTSEDIRAVTFDMAVRGYRMAEVDHYLERVAHDIAFRDERILGLQAELEAVREGRAVEPGQLEPGQLEPGQFEPGDEAGTGETAAEPRVPLAKANGREDAGGSATTGSAEPEVGPDETDKADRVDEVNEVDGEAADELPRWAG